MYNLERILKDCFWDLSLTMDKIKNILKSDEPRAMSMIFEKILLNSTALFQDLEIFDKERLQTLLDNYKVPEFNKEYAIRRKNMVEVYFF